MYATAGAAEPSTTDSRIFSLSPLKRFAMMGTTFWKTSAPSRTGAAVISAPPASGAKPGCASNDGSTSGAATTRSAPRAPTIATTRPEFAASANAAGAPASSVAARKNAIRWPT